MSEPRSIEKAAVIGSGVMGGALAAHLANAGVPTLLLDVKPTTLEDAERERGLTLDDREVGLRVVRRGFEATRKSKPPAFFTPAAAALVDLGNLDDHVEALEEVDWVIEAVVEDLAIKQDVLARVAPFLGTRTVLTTNTSGLSIAALSDALPAGLRPRFFATHFFNPPRYLELLETVAGPETAPELIEAVESFAEERLGKGVVRAKDTPNFIANRLGVFSLVHAMRAMEERGLTVADVDALTGPVIGRPKSATLRTADVVGLDTLAHVASDLADRLPDDPERDTIAPPAIVRSLVDSGRLGQKSGAGFYRKGADRVIRMLDLESLEYIDRNRPEFAGLDAARRIPSLAERLRILFDADDAGARFVRDNLTATIAYAAGCIPEIADDLPRVDRAMRWGFGWELGPFELFDAIGADRIGRTLDELGRTPPPLLRAILDRDEPRFYKEVGAETVAYDPTNRKYAVVPRIPRRTRMSDSSTIAELPDAVLVDLGDGVAGLEFASKRNTITPNWIDSTQWAIERVEREHRGLVIGSDADDFCVGANLKLIADAIDDGRFEDVESIVRSFQDLVVRLRTARRPVVIAPRGRVLGGGCEIVLAGPRVRAAAECYLGLVEVGAGLVPAGGGVTALLRRLDEALPGSDPVPLSYVRRLFEMIGTARVSTSAPEAFHLGFLRPGDAISMNRHRVIADAKETVIAMDLERYRPERPRTAIRILGRDALAALRAGIDNMREAGWITEFDAVVGDRLASVLCGGEASAPSRVSEAYLMGLERRAFVDLCRESQTRERIAHLLETGKPLRN